MLSRLKTAIAAAALIASCSAASAADLTKGYQSTAPFSWTGITIGAYGGTAAANNSDTSSYNYSGFPAFSGATDNSFDMKGRFFGVRAGFDYQWQWLVVGAFVAYEKSNITGSKELACTGCGYSDLLSTSLKWSGTAAGTIGVAFNRSALYVGGGLNYGVLSACERFSFPGYNSTTCNDYGAVGPMLLAGFKYAPFDYLVFGFEYQKGYYTALKSSTADNLYTFRHDIKADVDKVLAYALWKFSL